MEFRSPLLRGCLARLPPATWAASARAARATTTFTLQNPGTTAESVDVSAERLVQTSEYEWTANASNDQESPPDFTQARLPLGPHFPCPARHRPGKGHRGNELYTISRWPILVRSSWACSPPGVSSPTTGTTTTTTTLAYIDLNDNGTVNAGEDDRGEINRLTYGYNINDGVEIEVQKPLERSHDGFLIGLQHQVVTNYILTSTIHLKLTTYRKQAWPWLSTLERPAKPRRPDSHSPFLLQPRCPRARHWCLRGRTRSVHDQRRQHPSEHRARRHQRGS